jgi:hypothetical protein
MAFSMHYFTALSLAGYTALNDRMINYELERIYNKTAIT